MTKSNTTLGSLAEEVAASIVRIFKASGLDRDERASILIAILSLDTACTDGEKFDKTMNLAVEEMQYQWDAAHGLLAVTSDPKVTWDGRAKP